MHFSLVSIIHECISISIIFNQCYITLMGDDTFRQKPFTYSNTAALFVNRAKWVERIVMSQRRMAPPVWWATYRAGAGSRVPRWNSWVTAPLPPGLRGNNTPPSVQGWSHSDEMNGACVSALQPCVHPPFRGAAKSQLTLCRPTPTARQG